LLPDEYRSHLRILVKNERANSLISFGDQTQGLVYLNDISESQINTEIELLNSGTLLREVAKRCHLDDLVSPSVKDVQKREDTAFHDLQDALVVAPAHRSDVVEVSYESGDAKQSALVLQVLAELYQSSHLKLHGAPGSYAFFDKLWKDTARQSDAAASQLAAFKKSRQIVSLPEEKSLLMQHVTDLQKEAESSSASASKSEQEAATYKDSLSHMPRSIEKAGDRTAQEVASGANPTFLSAQSELVRANAEHAGGLAQAGSLREQLRRDQGRLAQLEASTVDYDVLARRSTELINVTESYRKKRDDAKANELLDKQNLSNVAIVEQPVVEASAVSPRRGIIAGLGFLWSLALAAVTAMVFDWWNRPIQPQIIPLAFDKPRCFMMLAALPQDAGVGSLANSFPEVYLAMQRTSSSQRGVS
jgi:uncharacterized protein involved in exopolysaccharide biosynthesis